MPDAPRHHLAHAVPRHFDPEPFRDFARSALDVRTPWVPGVCFLPECGASFSPRRDWQIYCCQACERAGTAEMRRWGHRLALSSLVYRMGKDLRTDPDMRALSTIARRHVSYVRSLWIEERRARSEGGRHG